MSRIEELQQYFADHYPQPDFVITELGDNSATIKKVIGPEHLRPGNTVSGPVLMEVTDIVVYVAILNTMGPVPQAVTTNLSINFLRRPSAENNIIAHCNLLKRGRTLVVAEVSLYSEGKDAPVAHAVVTYAMPAKSKT